MKTDMKKKLSIKGSFQSVSSRYGSYSLGAIALVVAIVIVANLVVGQLPENIRSVDLSDNKIYEITDASRKMAKGLEDSVTITVLAEKDQTDNRIKNFVEKYAGLSSKISLKWVDPVLHPSALTEYGAEEDSLVVECKATDKQRIVPFTDIITYDQMSYYTTGSMQEDAFDGEGQLTAAVNYVTSTQSRQIYYSTGHGEADFSSSVQDLMEKANYSLSEWNLVMNPAIPEDCELFIINGAAKDVTEEEQEGILTYLQQGGKVMILLAETEQDTPNLNAICKEYGLEKENGYIADVERSYQQNPYYIFPVLSLGEDLSKDISSEMVLIINAQGFTQTDPGRDTITVDAFMNTSSSGYAVTDKEEKQGTYVVGAVATETLSANSTSGSQSEDSGDGDAEAEDTEDKKDAEEAADTEDAADAEETSEDGQEEETGLESRLTVLGAASMIDANITDTFTTLENLTLFMNMVGANFGDDTSISIEPKSLAVTYNTVQYPGLFSLLVIFGIPVAVLGVGFVAWFRRRKA